MSLYAHEILYYGVYLLSNQNRQRDSSLGQVYVGIMAKVSESNYFVHLFNLV